MSFGLVKWLSGKEKGTLTVVASSWISEIDLASFDNTRGLC
jgi:hypothetical protein